MCEYSASSVAANFFNSDPIFRTSSTMRVPAQKLTLTRGPSSDCAPGGTGVYLSATYGAVVDVTQGSQSVFVN